MKRTTILLAGLTLVVSAFTAFTQPAPGDGPRRQPDGPPGRPLGDGQRPPLSPLMALLDANHDGVIDAKEIANAPAALKTLDKNSDGQLTPDELRPPLAGPRGLRDGPRGRGPGGPPRDNGGGPPPSDY